MQACRVLPNKFIVQAISRLVPCAGFPSVGKSTLLNKLTGTFSEVRSPIASWPIPRTHFGDDCRMSLAGDSMLNPLHRDVGHGSLPVYGMLGAALDGLRALAGTKGFLSIPCFLRAGGELRVHDADLHPGRGALPRRKDPAAGPAGHH